MPSSLFNKAKLSLVLEKKRRAVAAFEGCVQAGDGVGHGSALTPRHGLLNQFVGESGAYQERAPPDRISPKAVKAGTDKKVRKGPLVGIYRPSHPFERGVHLAGRRRGDRYDMGVRRRQGVRLELPGLGNIARRSVGDAG